MFNLQFDRKRSTHYQALLGALCGEVILVFYEGSPEKTQLDEHEEICPLCAEARKQGTTFPRYAKHRNEILAYRMKLAKDTNRVNEYFIKTSFEELEIKTKDTPYEGNIIKDYYILEENTAAPMVETYLAKILKLENGKVY